MHNEWNCCSSGPGALCHRAPQFQAHVADFPAFVSYSPGICGNCQIISRRLVAKSRLFAWIAIAIRACLRASTEERQASQHGEPANVDWHATDRLLPDHQLGRISWRGVLFATFLVVAVSGR